MALVGGEFVDKLMNYATVWLPARSIVEQAIADRFSVCLCRGSSRGDDCLRWTRAARLWRWTASARGRAISSRLSSPWGSVCRLGAHASTNRVQLPRTTSSMCCTQTRRATGACSVCRRARSVPSHAFTPCHAISELLPEPPLAARTVARHSRRTGVSVSVWSPECTHPVTAFRALGHPGLHLRAHQRLHWRQQDQGMVGMSTVCASSARRRAPLPWPAAVSPHAPSRRLGCRLCFFPLHSNQLPGHASPHCPISSIQPIVMPPVVCVLVVGFHHKLGPHVEYMYPPDALPLTGQPQEGTLPMPPGWAHLPV
jgi:hypothetical protein